ncbi:unnamed protein product, partial [Nesidiocoris tenuis]
MKRLEKQLQILEERTRELEGRNGQQHQTNETSRSTNTTNRQLRNIPPPKPVVIDENIAENLEFFEKSWKRYCVASGLEEFPDSIK